ncbi:MAG: hypothetical protein QM778_11590 [Myxococcales bacterium]
MRITRTRLLILLSTLLTILPTTAWAADVAIFPAETSNLAPADNLAVGELLAQAYAGVSRQAVLSPVRTEYAVAHATTYEGAAQSLGVTEYVRTSTLAVGRLIVITATRYTSDGTFVYQSKMTAHSMEDLPAISDRMAKALWHRVDDSEVRTRDNVVQDEARVKPRVASEKVFGFKTGVYFPMARGAKFDTSIGLQFDIRFEMDRFFLEFAAGFIFPTSFADNTCSSYDESAGYCTGSDRKHGTVGGFTGEIGASYFLTNGNAAPYIGIGLIPRLTVDINNDVANMLAYAQLGIMLPRDSSIRFYGDFRASQGLLETHLENGAGVHTTELTLHVGFGW